MKNIELSSEATELLATWVYDHESDSSHDSRGFYAEFDSQNCKPNTPMAIAELIDNGLAKAHPDSSYIPSVDDILFYEDEDSNPDEDGYSGVAFLKITEKGKTYLTQNKLI